MTWTSVGRISPTMLSSARLQLHWAAQLVSAPGSTLLPAEADYGHTTLVWDRSSGVLKGRAVGAEALHTALSFEGLELLVLGGPRERSLTLAGHTMEQALSWLGEQICGESHALALPEHELPSHPLGKGEAFTEAGEENERAELAAWFANATTLIRDLTAEWPNASPVRCWPHHFDVASLITLDADGSAESARSIGVGLSPGDGSYDQPYFYVTPWPYPSGTELPSLPSGARWHTEGWVGAVLPAEAVISWPHGPHGRQEETARKTLEAAIMQCRTLLGS